MSGRLLYPIVMVLLVLGSAVLPAAVLAQATAQATTQNTPQAQPDRSLPSLQSLPGVGLNAGREDFEMPVQLLLLMTVLSLAPAIVILMTSFTRLVVVFGILRTAMGTHQSPPTQVITGLSLFLTLFIMAPVFNRVNTEALQPYMAGTISQKDAFARASEPMKRFMLNQTRDKDLMLFMDMGNVQALSTPTDVPLHVLVPAFVISELRIAFQIGFMLFLPFVIVDLIVASVLMSMGMMMLPPVMISLPLKLLLFVLTDGWYLIVQSLVQGYTM